MTRTGKRLLDPDLTHNVLDNGSFRYADAVLDRLEAYALRMALSTGRLYPIEIKCKSNLTRHDARGLRAFRDLYGPEKVARALIIYAGSECYDVASSTPAVPWNVKVQHL